MERTERSRKVSLKSESFAAVGKFWLKLKSLNELGKLSLKLKIVTSLEIMIIKSNNEISHKVMSKIILSG